MNALCTISDSGTISEESAILSFPAISLRQSMERPEAQDAGTIILTGFDQDCVLDAITLVIDEHTHSSTADHTLDTDEAQEAREAHHNPHTHDARYTYPQIPPDYTITSTSWRVLKLIQGNAGLSNLWWGVG
jgi:UDP-N-acetyl-L-fucosamine synthase